jgi:transcriptional regulator with XRE-family HTH domain
MDQPGDGPTVARIRLGARLRELRTAAGITGAQAAGEIRSSASKISRIEGGRVPVRPRDAAELLTLYGMTGPEERETLLGLARASARASWWDPFSLDLPAQIMHVLNLEAAAARIVAYDSQAVPALLQTADYAQALCSPGSRRTTWRGGLPADVLARRRKLLHVPRPPHLWAIIDEAVLHRPPPGRDPRVMAGQMARLIEAATTPGITVQIIPGRTPDTLRAPGPFTILRFPHGPELPDVVLLEQLTTISTVERLGEVDHYRETFELLAIKARDRASSLDLLQVIAGGLGGASIK